MKFMNLNDSLISFAGGASTGTYIAATDPTANPWITQILVPFLGAVLFPFLKELSKIVLAAIKSKYNAKKKP
jgi:hypothetical protein